MPIMAKDSKRYIERAERSLFDALDRMSQIDRMGDPLANLNQIMNWDIFVPVLDRIPKVEPKGPGGRPAFHPMFMFKVLVLQSLYGLADEQTQFQILDRRSFHRFLGITDADNVPDQNTIREFREKLTKCGMFEDLFSTFNNHLDDRGFITRKGHIADASFVEVPRQRNSAEDNEAIKEGRMPDGWEKQPKRLAHKDRDARWTKKHQQVFFGYKNHVNIDLESKLIVRAVVTDASVHDSQALDALTRESDPETWLDSGYSGQPCAELLAAKSIPAQVCEKGVRGKPLTRAQKRANRNKSKRRSRVEHVFGFMTVNMKAMYKRCVGMVRNRASIIFCNLVYNMARTEQIIRLKILGRRTPRLA
jgi:IS5 family transposase